MGLSSKRLVRLPPPNMRGETSVEQALAERRSRRELSGTEISEQMFSQLLWSAQGTTSREGYRTAPSAGALYPLEIYVAQRTGLCHYVPHHHAREMVNEDDLRPVLWKHGLEQDVLRDAASVFIIAAVLARTRAKYSSQAERYIYMEAGHVAQNLLLQAAALGLYGVPIGAFDERRVGESLGLPAGVVPIYLVAIGAPR